MRYGDLLPGDMLVCYNEYTDACAEHERTTIGLFIIQVTHEAIIWQVLFGHSVIGVYRVALPHEAEIDKFHRYYEVIRNGETFACRV